MISAFPGRAAGPRPIAYQLGEQRVLCAPNCLPERRAQQMTDAGRHVGDVHPWTVDLSLGDEDLRCDGCGRVLVQAPALIEETDEPAGGGAAQPTG
ncbi:hypothetical protein [Nonomuraea recticatena]|uniref:Uncharacterized protein n=1 Tax=Nonomuraea recticatena TaxID=46178 RepID=A0ABP6E3K1_9ACTN